MGRAVRLTRRSRPTRRKRLRLCLSGRSIVLSFVRFVGGGRLTLAVRHQVSGPAFRHLQARSFALCVCLLCVSCGPLVTRPAYQRPPGRAFHRKGNIFVSPALNAVERLLLPNIYVNRTLRRHRFVVHLSSFLGARPVTSALGVTLQCRGSSRCLQILPPRFGEVLGISATNTPHSGCA